MYKYTDSRLVILYMVTYNFAAIPASDYLIQNTRPSSRNPPMAYQQITTLKDFYLHVSPMDNNTLECTTTPHSHPAYLGTIQYGCLPGRPLQSLDANICINTLHRTIQTHLTDFFFAFISTNNLQLLVYTRAGTIQLSYDTYCDTYNAIRYIS